MNNNQGSMTTMQRGKWWLGACLTLLLLASSGCIPNQVYPISNTEVTPSATDTPGIESTPIAEGKPTASATADAIGESMDVSHDFTAQEQFEKGMEAFNTAMLRDTDPTFGRELSYPYFLEAYERFKEAVQIDPEFANAWYYVAASAAMGGEGAEVVIDALDRTLAIKHDYAEAWFLRATTYYQLGNNLEGYTSLNLAIESNPDYFEALLLRGIGSQNAQQWQAALTDYTHAKEIMDDKVRPVQAFTLYLNRGYVLYMTDEYEEAISDLSAAIKINPNDFYAHTLLGNAYLAIGDMKGCVETFHHALTLNPLLAVELKQNRSLFSDYQATLAEGSEEFEQVEELLQKIDEVS